MHSSRLFLTKEKYCACDAGIELYCCWVEARWRKVGRERGCAVELHRWYVQSVRTPTNSFWEQFCRAQAFHQWAIFRQVGVIYFECEPKSFRGVGGGQVVGFAPRGWLSIGGNLQAPKLSISKLALLKLICWTLFSLQFIRVLAI